MRAAALQRWVRGLLVLWIGLIAGCAPNSVEIQAGASESAPGAASVAKETQMASSLPVDTSPTPAGCSEAALIRASDASHSELIQLSGSTAEASSTSESPWGGCNGASSGPDAWYVLDLQGVAGAVQVHVILDAEFDAALDLRRGPCGDTLSLDCDRAAALGRPESALSLWLAAGVYWLVVDGKDQANRGDFRLQIELDPETGDPPPAPVNGSCEHPQAFGGLGLETVFAPPSATDVDISSYYSLDLSAEPAPVVATLSAWSLGAERSTKEISVFRAGAADAPCTSLVASDFLRGESSEGSDAELTTQLEPGRYTFELLQNAVPSGTEPGPSALTLHLDRELCRAGPVANTCETAIDLDTTPGAHVVEGSTVCNSDHFRLSDCNDVGSPEQFHRLDLRAESAPTRVRLTLLVDGLGLPPVLYLVGDGGAGTCGRGLYCFDSVSNYEGLPHYDLTLQPGVYFVGVESVTESVGKYRLLVELDRAEPSPCVTSAIDECVYGNYLLSCCPGWDVPECSELITLCGLAVETQSCVCARQPACCGAAGDTSGCAATYAACNYLCPDFAPSTRQCLDPGS